MVSPETISIVFAPGTGATDPGAGPNARRVIQLDQLLSELVSAGVITSAEAVLGDVLLVPVGRSHPVFRMDIDGAPRAAVKLFGPSRGETDGDCERERAVLALAGVVPELAAVIPESIPHSGPDTLVITRWVDGTPAWEGDSLTGGRATSAAGDLVDLVPHVMPRLVALHKATARHARERGLVSALKGPIPWGLRLFDGDAPSELWHHTAIAPLLASAAQRPVLVQGLRRARGAWRELSLVHGDLKHDNLLLAPGGEVWIVDWEMARLGDPAWDLAGLMFRPLLDPALEDAWSTDTIAAAAVLLDAYAGAARLPLAPLAQRLLLYCGAWLVMSVVQYRSTAANPDQPATERLLAAAERSFSGCDQIVGDLVAACGA